MRTAVFEEGSAALRQTPGVRKAGHPRQKWATYVRKHALEAAGGEGHLQEMMSDKVKWESAIRCHCQQATAMASATAVGGGHGAAGNQVRG